MTVVKTITGTLASAGYGYGDFLEQHGYTAEEDGVASIAADTLWDTGTDWVDVRGAATAHILVTTTGANASSSGTVDFAFIAKGDDGAVLPTPTVADFTITATLNATTKVTKGAKVDCDAYAYIKVFTIDNNDGSYAIEDSNAYVFYKTRMPR